MAPSADEFRQVMRRLPTGVSVLTMRAGTGLHGMTANTLTSVSLDPLLVLTCIDTTARAHDLLDSPDGFVANFLAAGQEELSRRFALRDLSDEERWDGVRWGPARTVNGVRLEGCTGYLECRVLDVHPGGDHSIFVAEVVDLEPGIDSQPLVFWQRTYRTLT